MSITNYSDGSKLDIDSNYEYGTSAEYTWPDGDISAITCASHNEFNEFLQDHNITHYNWNNKLFTLK